MLWSQTLREVGEALLVGLASLFHAALLAEEAGDVVCELCHIRVCGPQHTLPDGEGTRIQLPGRLCLPLCGQQPCQVVQRRRHLRRVGEAIRFGSAQLE
eukprot:9224479-Pyramimonas_sp.AAC.1